MNEQKIKEIFSDENFVTSLLELETPDEVQKALSNKGLDLTLEEISIIQKSLQNSNEGELSDEQLEDVAGGIAITSVIVGLIIGGAAVAGTVNLGKAVNNWTRRRW